MMRNDALTLAAVTLRLCLPLGIMLLPGLENTYNGIFDALFLDVSAPQVGGASRSPAVEAAAGD